MASPTHNPSQQPASSQQPAPVTFAGLRAAANVTPEQRAERDFEQEKNKRVEEICKRVSGDLSANEGQLIQELVTRRPSETEPTWNRRVAEFIQTRVSAELAAAGSVIADYSKFLADRKVAVSPNELQLFAQACDQNFQISLQVGVETCVKNAIGTIKETKKDQFDSIILQLTEKIHQEISKPLGQKVDSDAWIKQALRLCQELGNNPDGKNIAGEEVAKYNALKESLESPTYFQNIKTASTLAAVATHVVGWGAFAVASFPVAATACSLAMLGNIAIQGTLNYLGSRKRQDLQTEVTKGIKDATSMAGVVLFSGLLHKVIDQFKPSYLFSNEYVKPIGNTDTTKIEYTLKKIRDVALLVYEDPKTPKAEAATWLQKDHRVNSAWAQVESNVNAFFGRIKAHHDLLTYEALGVGVFSQLPMLANLLQGIS